ncbi:MAG: CysB family HTH-type transcriptional regulator [Burkholderiales bacterium]|nr:CysB family HTH-type transcriptional regulator [Burkholderiales bacterium]
MTLQQLRYLHEVVRHGLNISDAARCLFTSQPGISKQIRLLEEELGVEIFNRKRGRIVGLSVSGEQVLSIAEKMLNDAESLKKIGDAMSAQDVGNFVVAATHTQARYALPEVLKKFSAKYPKVAVRLKQGNPGQVSQFVLEGAADIGIATEALSVPSELKAIPCHQWGRVVITRPGHALQKMRPVSLEHIARFPIIAYDREFSARQIILQTFEAAGLAPNIVLSALDADVMKACVELDLGIAILTRLAFDQSKDKNLSAIDVGHLFPSSTTYIAVRRRNFLKAYMYDFIEMFSPKLKKHAVEKALAA